MKPPTAYYDTEKRAWIIPKGHPMDLTAEQKKDKVRLSKEVRGASFHLPKENGKFDASQSKKTY